MGRKKIMLLVVVMAIVLVGCGKISDEKDHYQRLQRTES